jgi:hypothetical protein
MIFNLSGLCWFLFKKLIELGPAILVLTGPKAFEANFKLALWFS